MGQVGEKSGDMLRAAACRSTPIPGHASTHPSPDSAAILTLPTPGQAAQCCPRLLSPLAPHTRLAWQPSSASLLPEDKL